MPKYKKRQIEANISHPAAFSASDVAELCRDETPRQKSQNKPI